MSSPPVSPGPGERKDIFKHTQAQSFIIHRSILRNIPKDISLAKQKRDPWKRMTVAKKQKPLTPNPGVQSDKRSQDDNCAVDLKGKSYISNQEIRRL